MALASWSPRRILALWAGGLTLQALLILAPVLLARHLMANSAEMLRIGAEQDDRWHTAELADSLSVAKQRADARAAGTYSVTPSGETLFALVHVPSGRPDSAVVAARSENLERTARYTMALLFGLIPAILLLLTLSWIIVRRNATGPASSFSAP